MKKEETLRWFRAILCGWLVNIAVLEYCSYSDRPNYDYMNINEYGLSLFVFAFVKQPEASWSRDSTWIWSGTSPGPAPLRDSLLIRPSPAGAAPSRPTGTPVMLWVRRTCPEGFGSGRAAICRPTSSRPLLAGVCRSICPASTMP